MFVALSYEKKNVFLAFRRFVTEVSIFFFIVSSLLYFPGL